MPKPRPSPGSQRSSHIEAPPSEAASGILRAGRKAHLAAVSMLAAVLLATFANTLRDLPFLLDSKLLILQDPRLGSPFPQALRQIFGQDYWWPHFTSGLYRPITTLSYFLNYSILGNGIDSTGYHAINLALHALNAALVYLLAMILLKNARLSWFIAALFGAHPIVTESVTNIVGRSDLLAALAVLGGLLCHIGSTLAAGRRRVCLLLAVAGCLLLGAFAKESAIVLVGVILLYDLTCRAWTDRDRGFLGTAGRFWSFARRDYWAWLPGLVAFFAMRSRLFAALPPVERPILDNPLLGADFWAARATAIGVVGRYLALLIWPRRLSCDYSYNQVPLVTGSFSAWGDFVALVSLFVIVLAILAAVLVRSHHRAASFFILFFFVTLLPTSNLIVPIGSIMAERFLYLPLVGFAGCLVLGLDAACRAMANLAASRRISMPAASSLSLGVMAIVTIACSVRTSLRNLDWADGERLWSGAVTACPRSYKAHGALAEAIFEKDPRHVRLDRVIEEAEKAVEIAGQSHLALTNLGFYYRIKGDLLASQSVPVGASASSPSPAVEWYEKSVKSLLRAVPVDRAHNEENRSREIRRGRKPEEIPDTGSDEIYWNLGTSYMRLGRYEAAMEAFRYSRRLAPMNADAYVDIALALMSSGRQEEAVIPWLQALVLQAGREDALRSLVEIYGKIDAGGCSLIPAPGQPRPRLNTDCPRVRRDICAAHEGLAEVFLETRRPALARKIRERAAAEYSCQRETSGDHSRSPEPSPASPGSS